MNWLRLLEIIEMAFGRTGNQPKVDRGWGWLCYCRVCCELRKEGSDSLFLTPTAVRSAVQRRSRKAA